MCFKCSEVEGCDPSKESAEVAAETKSPAVGESATVAGLSEGVPTNLIAVEPSHVALEEGSTAAMFWSLLARAGYEVW